MVASGVICLVSPSLVPPVLLCLSLCLSVSVSLPVSLNVCVCDVGVALLSFWWLPDCCWASTPAPSLTPATHQLIHSAEYQPWSFSHSLPGGCSSRFIRTQALQIVVSSYSLCVYSPFTLFFLCHSITACLPGCALPSLQFSHPVSQILVSQNSPLLSHASSATGLPLPSSAKYSPHPPSFPELSQ